MLSSRSGILAEAINTMHLISNANSRMKNEIQQVI